MQDLDMLMVSGAGVYFPERSKAKNSFRPGNNKINSTNDGCESSQYGYIKI